MPEFLSLLLTILIVVVGARTVIKGTKQRSKWGINGGAVINRSECPNCGAKLPRLRKPANLKQLLWGGWTCPQCTRSFDKWGNPDNG